MPPRLLDDIDLEALRRSVYSSIKIENVKEKENVDMATITCDSSLTVSAATVGSSTNISTKLNSNGFPDYHHDGIPLGTLVTSDHITTTGTGTCFIDAPKIVFEWPKNWDCCGSVSAKINELGEDSFMNKKFNTDTAKTWTDIGKRMYVKGHVAVFFKENYVVFKLIDKIPKNGLACPAGTVRKYELPISVMSDGKFEAFCHGLSRFYNEFLRDLFGDDVSVERTIDYPSKKETCVIFKDGSEVRCAVAEGDEVSEFIYEETDNFFGVDICFCKKIFGSTSAIKEILEWCDIGARRAKERAEYLKQLKELRKMNRELRMKEDKEVLEREIHYEMHRMYVQQQAVKRWNERTMKNYKAPAPFDDMVIYTEEPAPGRAPEA